MIESKTIDINRAFLISDTHFGVRSNSVEWMEIQRDYFENFFIPLLKNNMQPGDVLLHLGDMFDSRQTINIKVLNFAQEIFEKIAKIIPVHIIVGNHDIYQKRSNNINSLTIFKWTKNIHVYTEPCILKSNTHKNKIVLLPWEDDPNIQKENIINAASNYAFCHTDIQNIKFNKKVLIEKGIPAEIYKNYKGVYTGHIHYTQKYSNIRVIGSPYEITRSDSGNQKGIWMIDFINDKEAYFENTESPKFLKLKLSTVIDFTLKEAKEKFHNNFIDILISSEDSITFPFANLLDILAPIKYRKLSYIVVQNEQFEDYENNEESDFDLLSLTNYYIDELQYAHKIKEMMKDYTQKLFQRFMKSEEDEI